MNFVPPMITATTPVVTAPMPLMTMLRLEPGSGLRSQCTTMPPCESVKDRKTPNAYSGISRFTSALNTMSSPTEAAPSTMMPFENASRSPRNRNWWGRKRSRARIEPRRGKSA